MKGLNPAIHLRLKHAQELVEYLAKSEDPDAMFLDMLDRAQRLLAEVRIAVQGPQKGD